MAAPGETAQPLQHRDGIQVEAEVECPDMSRGARLTARSDISTALALCSDRALGELVDAAAPIGSGIGGKSALLEIAGTRVFVKRVPLTDLERQPEHARSTANMFALPAFFQYGIGSPGFGAWRELAVHTMTTNWVLAGSHEGFPQMYHWRVLPGSQPSMPGELADVERAVAYWGGGSQVRHRIEALRQSSASIALFLEYIPQNLHEWLGVQVSAGDDAANRALTMVEKELEAVRKYAQGERPEGIPEAAAAILTRHAPLAVVMSDFYRELQRQSRKTPYPLEKIRKLDGMNSSLTG
jgi:hypothetical protein